MSTSGIQPTTISQAVAPADSDEARALFRRIRMHIIPFLLIGYTVSFLDRINVGFTQLQMKHALGITDAHFGMAAGLFFVTYVLCEVPSNMLIEKIGARKQLLRIMVLWGLTSAAAMFVRTPNHYYIERLLLGAFEAGFYPGMILYLSYWFPSQERATAIAEFNVGAMIAGLIGGPVSGLIMTHLNGAAGLQGWQWCFLIEGLPAVVIGIVCFLCLSDKPEHAKWLSDREKAIIAAALEAERKKDTKKAAGFGKVLQALADPRVYLLAFLVLACQGGGMIVNFWLPTMIKELGVKSLANIGYLAMIPFLCGAIGMLIITRVSDRLKERRWHFTICVLAAAVAILFAPHFNKSLGWTLVLMSILAIGLNSAIPMFWSMPARYLGKEAAAVGIGVIAALGQLGPFASPITIGLLKAKTGSMASGLYVHAAVLIVAALLMVFVVPRRAVQVGAEVEKS